jgi:hypothetical protein
MQQQAECREDFESKAKIGAAQWLMREIYLLLFQGYETFESCFRSMTGRNILPYSSLDEGGTLMQWLSPLRR